MSLTATRPEKTFEQPRSLGLLDWLPLKDFFLLDVRSLALFRVAIGLLLLLDWVDRLPYLRVLYSDQGILPREIISGMHPISVHMLHGSVWFQAMLAGIAILFALFLLVGYRTPFATLVSWFLLISVHTRNPCVLQGGDQLFRMMLFWSIFLPLGACYSIDSARDREGAPQQVLSPASVAYILQLCIMYWFAGAWKWDPTWREEGTAVYLAVQVDYFTTRFGLFLLQFPEALRWLTHATMLLETVGPVILFLPFAVGFQRLVLVAAFILFHAGLAVSMELGNFPWLCMAAWLPLLPTSFWNRLQAQLHSDTVAGLTIYHDADRPRAVRVTAWLRTFLLLGEAHLAAAQEEPERLARLRKQGGWGLVDRQGSEHVGGSALRLLFSLSPIFFPLGWVFATRPGQVMADWLARRVAGPGSIHPTPPPARPAWQPPGGLIAHSLVVFFLLYVVVCNVWMFADGRHKATSPGKPFTGVLALPWQFSHLASVLGLEQGWGLFAPGPGRTGGWFLVEGIRKDGSRIDLMRDGMPVNQDRPELPSIAYPNNRWRKMMMNLPVGSLFPYLLPGFTKFQYDDWNRNHEGNDRVQAVEVYWMMQPTVPPEVHERPIERILLGRYEPRGQAATVLPGWILVVGTLPDGRQLDLLRNGAVVDFAKPDPRTSAVTAAPWSGFLMSLLTSDARPHLLPGYVHYLFEEWNKQHQGDRRLLSLEVIQLREVAGQPDAPPHREVLARYPEVGKK